MRVDEAGTPNSVALIDDVGSCMQLRDHVAGVAACPHASFRVERHRATDGRGSAQARLLQLAFYLAAFATTAIALAIGLNWRNDRLGFWLNAVSIGVADVPFIVFILVPGYMPWWPGMLGPVLWIVGLACTAISRSRPAELPNGSLGLPG